jgi:hypothetical protein
MVVRVEPENMSSKVLYPPEEQSAERIALLTGIVQLVSTALKRDGGTAPTETPNYMKSDKGVLGYVQGIDNLYICEADNEKEAGSVLTIIIDNPNVSEEAMITMITKALRKRGREISSLWG